MSAVKRRRVSSAPRVVTKAEEIEAETVQVGLDTESLQNFLISLEATWPNTRRFERRAPFPQSRSDTLSAIENDVQQVTGIMGDFTDACQRALSLLRSQHNSEVDINAILPEDVLCHIFETAAENGYDHVSVLAISHTCARWRDICFRNPSIYHCIDISTIPVKIGELFISTNLNLPLCLRFMKAAPVASLLARQTFCASSLARAKEFCLTTSPSWVPLGRRSPLLTTVMLVNAQAVDGDGLITSSFLSQPKLSQFTMIGMRYPWNSGAYARLSKLCLIISGLNTGFHDDDLDVLQLFQKSPNMVECTILVSKPVSIQGRRPQKPKELISMPGLRTLYLKLLSSDLDYILSSISTPPTMKATLTAMHDSRDHSPLAWIPLDPRCLPCFHVMDALCLNRRDFRILAFKNVPDGWCREPEPTVTIAAEWYAPPQPYVLCPILGVTRILHSMSSLKALDVQEMDSWCYGSSETSLDHLVKDVFSLLNAAPTLNLLTLDKCPEEVLELLATQKAHSSARFCVGLHRLSCSRARINKDVILRLCQTFSKQIQALRFLRCRFESKDVEAELLACLGQIGVSDIQSDLAEFE
ncbi:unnamed protein product [Somion occarium]|uniref:F-box domain-containing protein n=1 Tax=Somion occarium TaxID=3059160 RepID=A0ABP1D6H8_9APHY